MNATAGGETRNFANGESAKLRSNS